MTRANEKLILESIQKNWKIDNYSLDIKDIEKATLIELKDKEELGVKTELDINDIKVNVSESPIFVKVKKIENKEDTKKEEDNKEEEKQQEDKKEEKQEDQENIEDNNKENKENKETETKTEENKKEEKKESNQNTNTIINNNNDNNNNNNNQKNNSSNNKTKNTSVNKQQTKTINVKEVDDLLADKDIPQTGSGEVGIIIAIIFLAVDVIAIRFVLKKKYSF